MFGEYPKNFEEKIRKFLQETENEGLFSIINGQTTKWENVRSSHRKCSVTRVVLRNFAKFTGKHRCQSLFFNNVAGLRPATLLKKVLWHRCFPVNFAKFPRTPFLTEHIRRQLLEYLNWRRSRTCFQSIYLFLSNISFQYPQKLSENPKIF